MKRLLILLAVMICFGASLFAKDEEISIYFIAPFNQNEFSDETVSGYGGMIDYKRMGNDIWGLEYQGSLTFPKKGTPIYNRYLTFDVSVGLALRLFNNQDMEIYMVPSAGYRYISDDLWADKKSSHEYSYIWIGGNIDFNYKLTSVLYLGGGFNMEYSFYKMQEPRNEAIGYFSVIPKVGIVLVM